MTGTIHLESRRTSRGTMVSATKELGIRLKDLNEVVQVADALRGKFVITAILRGIMEPISENPRVSSVNGLIPHGFDRCGFVGYVDGRAWISANRSGAVQISVFNLRQGETDLVGRCSEAIISTLSEFTPKVIQLRT